MDTALVIVLLAMAVGVGLCLGYLIGHTASHERESRRGVAAKRYFDALEKRDEIDHSYGVRFHR